MNPLCICTRAFLLGTLVCSVDAANIRNRRQLQEEESDVGSESKKGFFGNLLHNFWRGDSQDVPNPDAMYSDTGAEVYLITFSDETAAALQRGEMEELDNLNITRVTQEHGINGNSRNRYVWSMALDDNEDLYIGTINQNVDYQNLTCLIWSVVMAPIGSKFNAAVDALLRQWSGLPIFESDGGQIFYKAQEANDFAIQLQTSPEHLGFRKMVNYNGNIYAGSANGPNGPYGWENYDFDELYADGEGAKIFTNAGGTDFFDKLDDEGNLDQYDKTIRGMVVSSYSNRLFIGTETYRCAKLLIYSDDPATTGFRWKSTNFEDTHCGLSVSQLYDMGDGKILFGAWQELNYAVFMLDEKSNDEITKLTTPFWPLHVSMGVMEIRLFKGHLYVGILSFLRGFALIRTSKTSVEDLKSLTVDDWEVITMNGFQQEQEEQLGKEPVDNDYTWAGAIANGVYFIGTFSSRDEVVEPTGQLWGSYDGLNWKLIKSDALSSKYMYGYRTMSVTKDEKKLYIGSATNMYIPDGRGERGP